MKRFRQKKARALCERFEIHYTPKHGSWFNMAEIEIGLLSRTCLDRRIGSTQEFKKEITAYLDWKNQQFHQGFESLHRLLKSPARYVAEIAEFFDQVLRLPLLGKIVV